MTGRPLATYRNLAAAKRYVTDGRWDGSVLLGEPDPTASIDEASGRYGVAFLTVRHLVERYGEERMLAFFEAVGRRDVPVEQASADVFGVSWREVAIECAAAVRRGVA
jgi:hypothetical protein